MTWLPGVALVAAGAGVLLAGIARMEREASFGATVAIAGVLLIIAGLQLLL